MAQPRPRHAHGFSVRSDQPLIGVLVQEGDHELVRYFTDEPQADATTRQRRIQKALSLAGAWQDLDWAEALDDLDRIRHESRPTPPIEL